MQIGLVLKACARVLETIKSSSLDTQSKNELTRKVEDIAQKAISSSEADSLEETLHSDECIGLEEEEAVLALYQRVYTVVVGDSTQKTRSKMEDVARAILTPPPEPTLGKAKDPKKSKTVQIAKYSTQGHEKKTPTKFGSKTDLDTVKKSPPFHLVPSLQRELNKEISPEVDLGGKYKDILEPLAQQGITTNKEILDLSAKRLVKILGLTDPSDIRDVVLMRQAIIDSLKSLHQSSLEEDLDVFLDTLDSDSLVSSIPDAEGFLSTPQNQEAFRTFVDNIIAKGYDPGFALSNSSIESLAERKGLNEQTVKRLIFEARIEAFAQLRLASFKEKASLEDDLDTSYCQFFDSLVNCYTEEKGERIDKEDLAHPSLVFQAQLNDVASQVERGELDKTKALSELKIRFLQAFEEEHTHLESLTPEEFIELPSKSLPTALTRQLRKEIEEGTWKSGEVRDIEILNISSGAATRLRATLSLVLSSPEFNEASSVYFRSLKTK